MRYTWGNHSKYSDQISLNYYSAEKESASFLAQIPLQFLQFYTQ
jgi:hypothetical protein